MLSRCRLTKATYMHAGLKTILKENGHLRSLLWRGMVLDFAQSSSQSASRPHAQVLLGRSPWWLQWCTSCKDWTHTGWKHQAHTPWMKRWWNYIKTENDTGNEVAVTLRRQLWSSFYSCFLHIYNSLWLLALLLRELAVFLFIAVVKSCPDVPQCFHVKLSDREHETGEFNCGNWFGLVDRQNCDQLFKNGFCILRSALENWFTVFRIGVLVQQVWLSCLCEMKE